MTKVCLSLLFLIGPGLLLCQNRHSLKLDLGILTQKGVRVAYAIPVNPGSSLELTAGYQKHGNQPTWMFQGDQIAHYLQQKMDTFDQANRLLSSSGWKNTESQPLPDAPEFFPLTSYQFKLAWRFNFGDSCSKWQFFLQPGLSASRFQFFEITGGRRIEFQNEDKWYIGVYPYQTKIVRESAVYEQTRYMRLKNEWVYGLTYDLGFDLKLNRHLFIEGRLEAGVNWESPYKSPRPPLWFRSLWARPNLLLGWKF